MERDELRSGCELGRSGVAALTTGAQRTERPFERGELRRAVVHVLRARLVMFREYVIPAALHANAVSLERGKIVRHGP